MSVAIYNCFKRMIQKENYESKEAMAEQITLIYMHGQLTKDQYDELMNMLQG